MILGLIKWLLTAWAIMIVGIALGVSVPFGAAVLVAFIGFVTLHFLLT